MKTSNKHHPSNGAFRSPAPVQTIETVREKNKNRRFKYSEFVSALIYILMGLVVVLYFSDIDWSVLPPLFAFVLIGFVARIYQWTVISSMTGLYKSQTNPNSFVRVTYSIRSAISLHPVIEFRNDLNGWTSRLKPSLLHMNRWEGFFEYDDRSEGWGLHECTVEPEQGLINVRVFHKGMPEGKERVYILERMAD